MSLADGPPPAAPRVSVCVVNWNSSRLLAELLDSLAAEAQQLPIETIVVDNNSSDDSVSMINSRYAWVRLVTNAENRGFSAANNQAAALATGTFLLFLNNDTRVRPGAIRMLADRLDARPDVAAVAPRLVFPDGRFQPSCRQLTTLPLLLHQTKLLGWTGWFRDVKQRHYVFMDDPGKDAEVEMFIGAAIMLRRSTFSEIGGWDEAFAFCVEDDDLCRRLAARGKLLFVHGAVIEHHGMVSAAANSIYSYRHYQIGGARYLRKHGRRWLAPLYKLLVTVDHPVRIVSLLLRIARYRLTGRLDRIAPARAALKAATSFTLRDLPRFWWS